MEKRKIVKTVVENFVVEGHSFVLCKDDNGHYWGFDKKYADGTVREFNGCTGHRAETLNETMRLCYLDARFENEIDKEKYKNLDLEEVKKFTTIIEESFEIYRK